MSTAFPSKEIYVRRELWDRSYAVHVFVNEQTPASGSIIRSYATQMTLQRVPDGEVCDPLPLMHLDATAAQQLMDELWRAGIRPTDGGSTMGQYSAMQRHLNDMRKLAGKALKTPLD